MKTTIELPDALLAQAKRLAISERTTLRSLIEEALTRLFEERTRRSATRELRDASYGSGGMSPEFAAGGWDAIASEIYQVPGVEERRT